MTRESILGAQRLERIGEAAAPERGVFTLAFIADGRATGTIHCNSLSAPYSVEGQRIAFGEGSRTLVGCRASPTCRPRSAPLFGAKRAWLSADGRRLVFDGQPRVTLRRAGS